MAYITKLAPSLPMQSVATLEQVAEAAYFLCRGSATGQLIFTDGGQHLL
jgi:hypothetical protein